MAHDLLHVLGARYVVRELRTISPWPFEGSVGDSSRRSEEIVNLELHPPTLFLLVVLSTLFFSSSSSSSSSSGIEV